MRVVGREEVVQLQWKRCVQATPGWKSDPEAEQFVYDFIFQKFHNVRVAEYCTRLRMVSDLFKTEKVTQQALRAKLKAASGPAKPPQRETNESGGGAAGMKTDLIADFRDGLVALRLTEVTFGKLTVPQLKTHIAKVGGDLTGHSRKRKRDLQDQLKRLVPGIIHGEVETHRADDVRPVRPRT